VFGIFGHSPGRRHPLTALGLHALQHRGQEAGRHRQPRRRWPGFPCPPRLAWSATIFGIQSRDRRLKGRRHRPQPLRHDRRDALRNVQPLFADFAFGGFAIGHNGNLTNAAACAANWCARLASSSRPPTPRSSSHLIAAPIYANVVDRLIDALGQVEGAYSLVALTDEG
jgi:amidophosphoribosyltransferase